MSRTKALEKVKLTRFDDLFGGKEGESAIEAGEVKQIPISELHEFHNHPFQIRSDEELEEMIESVRQHGVLVPGIVRTRKEGGYEIIAGHTRRHVCELLGIDIMPVFVKDLDDDEASLIMVDSNIQFRVRAEIGTPSRLLAGGIQGDLSFGAAHHPDQFPLRFLLHAADTPAHGDLLDHIMPPFPAFSGCEEIILRHRNRSQGGYRSSSR